MNTNNQSKSNLFKTANYNDFELVDKPNQNPGQGQSTLFNPVQNIGATNNSTFNTWGNQGGSFLNKNQPNQPQSTQSNTMLPGTSTLNTNTQGNIYSNK
jgi:hypothetical protein